MTYRVIAIALSFSVVSLTMTAADSAPHAGVVHHVSVTSDHVPDVSSLAAWKKAFITERMSDREKAVAIWRSITTFKQQDIPPCEFITGDGGDVHDAIKTFNVYGYGLCCCAASNVEELARYVGLEARGWSINGHSVSEIKYDGAWHLFDSALVCYWPKADGGIASVEEMIAGVTAWLDQNPQYKADNDKLRPLAQANGWKTNGPEILQRTTAYDDNGCLTVTPWHGWWSNLAEYNGAGGGPNGKAGVYDYGYSQGYEVNIQLRKGETLTRTWADTGKHVNMDGKGGAPNCLGVNIGSGFMTYSRALGDLANQRIGTGSTRYEVGLADGAFRSGALVADNLACTSEDKAAPAVHVRDAATPGVLVIRMPSSYVYLGGSLDYAAVIGNGGGIEVSFSDNNGLDWKPLPKPPASGAQTVDLKPFVYRRYDYQLKFTLTGAGTGLGSLTLVHDIQNSQRALPALDKGPNKIHVAAGPQEATVTIEANANLGWKAQQHVFTDFHPICQGLQDGTMRVAGGDGSIAFPITTPGDIVRLRFGCNYRARDAHDGWDLQVSFDGGKTYATLDHAAGETGNGSSKYLVCDKIPPKTREALVRFVGTQRNTTQMSVVRIDADYRPGNAGFLPVQVTYRWKENGQEKTDVHLAKSADESYTITCAEKPTMESIALAVAPK